MGKFLKTKYSEVQNQIIKKPGKSAQKCIPEYEFMKYKKLKRKLQHLKVQEPPCKKLKSTEADKPKPKSPIQNLKIELNTYGTSGNQYVQLTEREEDLFSDDELKARYDQYTKYNFVYHIFDEIALEGLDGITIEAFWKRLDMALKSTCLDCIKELIWIIVCLNEDIKFYELPETRPDLVVLNRDAFVNKDTHKFMEVYQTGPDIYKVVVDQKSQQLGSCATLSTRIDISDKVRNMTLNEAYSTYENKLVMVADHKIRLNALLSEVTDPNYEFNQSEFCILERIGRSRQLGEITQGPASLANSFNMDTKSVFHYCRKFIAQSLITKQFFCVRSTMDQNKIGRLMQLRRFYCKKKSKYFVLTESIINYLKKCPGFKAPYSSVRAIFEGPINPKFFKNPEFLKYVYTNMYAPYRDVNPDATSAEYMTKTMIKEKSLHVMQLRDPHLNILACYSDVTQDDSSEDDEDDDNEGNDDSFGISRTLNMEFLQEVYNKIRSYGIKGCSSLDLNSIFNIDFLTMRTCLKKLSRRNVVDMKKYENGRQKLMRYVAKCFLENPDLEFNEPESVEATPSTALERLKAKQKAKVNSLDKTRVYTREQFEVDQHQALLALDKPSSLEPITFEIPQVICNYLVSKLPQAVADDPIALARLTEAIKPFKINLTYPKLLGNASQYELREILRLPEEDKLQVIANFKYDYSKVFKPDYLTKAVLLQAHFGLQINKNEIIEFLDPTAKKTKTVKRGISVVPEIVGSGEPDGQASGKKDLVRYLGPHPVCVLAEKDEANDVVTEIFMSTLPESFKTGDILKYDSSHDLSMTERVVSRINIILETINKQVVFEECNKLLKIITPKEAEEGYDKKMDRKSLHRIILRLVKEGYIKVYQTIITNANLKRTHNYICHPDTDHNHITIKNNLEQIKFKIICGSNNKKAPPAAEAPPKKLAKEKLSPFVEDDVLQSIQEINELAIPKHITLKVPSKRALGKVYGYRPKFARMSLLHEIMFYLIYVLDKDTRPLPKTEILELFKKYKIKLTDEDFEQLPPVYSKELSWKMFIPPLPYHVGWDEGWALVCDIILRIPATLLARLHCINFYSTELQELLQHPIKGYYLLKSLPPQIKYVIMYRRKCIHDLYMIMLNLAYCGLVQFGPSRYKEKDQGFIYLNRRATLLETMSSEPGYHKVSVKEYPTLKFYFDSPETVSKYWTTLHNISMTTCLNIRYVEEGKTITYVDVSAKPSINKAIEVRKQDEVKEYDTGDIPGDKRGAAGLDSAMWAHIQKNWFYFALKKNQSFKDDLSSLKMDKVMVEQTSFDHLKLPPMASKFYLTKPQNVDTKPKTVTKFPQLKTSKKQPFLTKIMKKRKLQKKRREYYDTVDKAILRKYCRFRFRPNWSEEEDKALVLLKTAAAFIAPGSPKQSVCYTVMRDLLHKLRPESRNKTSRSIPRRLKILFRDVPFLSNFETLVLNLYKLPTIAKYFVPLRNYIFNEVDHEGKKFKVSDSEVHSAYMFLAQYIFKHETEVESTLHGNLTTMDYFSEKNLDHTLKNIIPVEQESKMYKDPTSVEEIRRYVLINIFHSALGHKTDHPAWSYQVYKIYQKFDETMLKDTIEELREVHMIQSKKEPFKKFFTPFKFSLSYVFSQATLFTYQTIEEAYSTYLDIKNEPKKLKFRLEDIESKKYGQMFGANEILTFMMNQINLKFWIPEHVFILNPEIKDHSQVIDELAKRYQAKLKKDRKDAESQVSDKLDQTESDIPRPEPGPSTSNVEDMDMEILQLDDCEPIDLSITATNSTTITNLKHWISDCIHSERVRSPSPELLSLDVSHELKKEGGELLNDGDETGDKEDKVLGLEEIKEEMLKQTAETEKRQVPYITDLAKMLSENWDDVETDERVDEMMQHFVQQNPLLEEIEVEGLKEHFLIKYLDDGIRTKEIWKRVSRDSYVDQPSELSKIFDEILQKGGTIEDVDLASELTNFVFEKGEFGATGPDIKKNFELAGGNCTLEFILKLLTDQRILSRTGICTITFVHHRYEKTWLNETFVLTNKIKDLFKRIGKDELSKKEPDMDKTIQTTQWFRVKSVPWTNVDGALDKNLFKVWLSSILSYCIENPNTMFNSLINKFCYLKPVDLFYLLEVLQELGCLEMRRFEPQECDLFAEYAWRETRQATFLDKFEEIYVDTNQISFISLGSFFCNC